MLLLIELTKAGLGAQEPVVKSGIPRSRRQRSSGSNGSPMGSPTTRSSDGSKHSRRHRSRENMTDSSARDSSGSSRHARRHRHPSNLGSESPSQELPSIPRRSHRKSKGSGGGSTRSSRSKGQDSLTEMQFAELGPGAVSGEGLKNNERLQEEKEVLEGEVRVE